jgi:V/A-type H+-transporting ATPase subunit A
MDRVGTVTAISGPVVRARFPFPVRPYEVAYVGHDRLLGEAIRISKGSADVQVYEATDGVRAGEPVYFSGELLSVDLGPGLLGSVLDGIGRPLALLADREVYIGRGWRESPIPTDKKWPFKPRLKAGDIAMPGTVLGNVAEKEGFIHMVMVPFVPEIQSEIAWIAPEGEYRAFDQICRLSNGIELTMVSRWHVREPRPVARKLGLEISFLAGQRVLDTLFPIALGGSAVIPGGFGTGKTVTQQQLAKYCNADIIVYIGCGERGNEMTEVLEEFPRLADPKSGLPLMDRTVLIANTSNMPVAAREASVYLGMTIAEYFRDMGKNVAIIADSTSRWAEALREISGRLGEMPGEEGYPAYLGSRLAQYYERAGRAVPLGEPLREGSVTVINAVSPAGGDFSEPVTQASLRLSGAFWALDKSLAQQRHFPAINWRQSYTLYEEDLRDHFVQLLGREWLELKMFLNETLERGQEALEIVQLVGRDALADEDRWLLLFAELLQTVYLQQNAFDPADAYCPLSKQKAMLALLRSLDEKVRASLSGGTIYEQIEALPIKQELLRLRSLPVEDFEVEAKHWIDSIRLGDLGR